MRNAIGPFVAAVVLVVCMRGDVRAQSTHQAEVVQLRARLDSLNSELDRVNVRDSLRHRAQRDSVTRANTEILDTAAVGPFLVVGTPTHVRRTRGYFDDAWEEMQPMFLGMDSVLRGHVFLVSLDGGAAWNLRGMRELPNHHWVGFPRTPNPLIRHNQAEAALGGLLMPQLPASVREWMGTGTVGMGIEANRLARYIVIPSDTVSSATGKKCMSGDMAACRVLLDLPDGGFVRGGHPLRTSFLTYILQRTPAGSVAALRTDTAPVGAALEKLAGLPLDTLLQGWLAGMNRMKEREAGTAGHRVLSTLAWIAIFGALSMRSTRWRLG